TLTIDPSGAWPSPEMYRCGPNYIASEPSYSDCRWKTKNVTVTDNDFRQSSRAALGCTSLCGMSGIFANGGTVPTWSPYKGDVVQQAITFGQNNRFSNNRYVGAWSFAAFNTGPPISWDQWRAAPYGQDAGSTWNGSTTTMSASATAPVATPPAWDTIWPDALTVGESHNGLAYTLGTRFVVAAAGYVAALRFYETPSMAGTITLKLWRATSATTGSELASTSYSAVPGLSGWRNVALRTPVAVAPNEAYVVTYHTPQPFPFAAGYLQTPRVSGDLTAKANNDPIGYRDGLYKEEYGTHTFPANGDGHSYFADVVFARA
ncbi:MAG: DUF4082 domain-containing protein, partial [Actinomycetota bacterium]|nr:DUF4082 domain-containing protein [Actinomycetota bacterium]